MKPSNLVVTEDGALKIIDFGIALWGNAERTQTGTGMLRGSLPYCSPEQARGEPMDARSDLHSLGLVLFELLLGHRVHDQPGEAAILYALLHADLQDALTGRADVSDAFKAALGPALRAEPDARPETARALKARIEAAVPMEDRWDAAQVGRWVLGLAPQIRVRTRTFRSRSPETLSLRAEAASTGLPRAAMNRRARSSLYALGLLAAAAVSVAGVRLARAPKPHGPPPPTASPSPSVPLPPATSVEIAPAPRTEIAPRPRVASAPKRTGWLSIDAQPWGTVRVDGRVLGPTPIFRQRVGAGTHRVELIFEDGRRRVRTLRVDEEQHTKALFKE